SSTRRSTSRVDFFFSAPAAPEIYPLSLHDALPIWGGGGSRPGLLARAGPASAGRLVLGLGARPRRGGPVGRGHGRRGDGPAHGGDRKSTRLNSSHVKISYAVFCLKKTKNRYIRASH